MPARALLFLGLFAGLLAAPAARADDPDEPDPGELHLRLMNAMRDPLGFSQSRDGSGTGWTPQATPMLGHLWLADEWALMLHYNVFAGFDAQSGPRGGYQALSTNWVMFMAQHNVGPGRFTARAMLSLEPLTTGGPAGYPLLLQSGETAGGVPLHDRQHPHDLFMEVAAEYRMRLTAETGLLFYLAASGEPALGPTAFPHRYSAFNDPLAPITHHWMDSTHISFGVLTAGFYTRTFQLEASFFNGREPDENRYNFDFRTPDSYSARATWNPTREISAQISYGFLKSPEVQEPLVSEHRITASVQYTRRLGSDRVWASTLVWGENIPLSSPELSSSAVLLETNLELGLDAVFGRAEWVQKNDEELVLPASDAGKRYGVSEFSLGYVRSLGNFGGVIPGVGIRASMDFVPTSLESLYGGRIPLGVMVFVRIRPQDMMAGMRM